MVELIWPMQGYVRRICTQYCNRAMEVSHSYDHSWSQKLLDMCSYDSTTNAGFGGLQEATLHATLNMLLRTLNLSFARAL